MKFIRNSIFITLFMISIVTYSDSIKVGVPQFAPPYSSLGADNHFYGFSIDFMNEICKRLADTCEYKAFSVEKQLGALDSGEIDIVLLLNPIPLKEQKKYIYSIPYITSDGEFVTSNPNLKSINDLKNKKIGIFESSHLLNIVLPLTKRQNIKEYDQVPALLSALKNNEVDALLLNVNIAKYLINNQILKVYVIGNSIPLGNGYGMIALPQKTDLINRINKVILQIENDGTYEPIYSKYFGT